MKHKLGIIGYGGMGAWHQENSKRVPDLECVAVYDINPERLKVAEERGLKAFNDIDDFFEKGDFDLVLVATPNNFHKDMSIKAMNKGKNVICEKPVAMSSQELEEMIEASERNKVLFTVHQNRRWDYDYRIVSKALKDGMVGKPYTIESRAHGTSGVLHGWRAYKVSGGGMLFDWGVHLIDQIMYMIPEKVVNVFALLRNIKTPEVDDYFKVLLTFESGLIAQIEVGTYCLKSLPRWYVNGDAGSIYVNGWECDGGIIRAKDVTVEWVPEVVQTVAGPTRTMAPRPKEIIEELSLPKVESDWIEYYLNVIAALEGKQEIFVKLPQVMRVMKVIDACFSSSRTGCAIQVNV